MVRLSTPSGIPYCIDTREVTQAQYAAFLDAKKGDMSGQDAFCAASNLRYEPEFALGGDNEPFTKCNPSQWDPKSKPTWPATCVDTCDARAYCNWVGKRLCGKVGGGTLIGEKEMLDPEKSQWYNACSQGGKTEYAYGSEQDPSKCKISGPQEDSMGCHATNPPYNEIFNLSGGLADMEDAREELGPFIQRGGRGNPEGAYRCKWLEGLDVTTATFRCCADL
jgi:formylglycine-generating enzyme required for sulfatase activity